ncbi:MAG: TolC family protein [Candidatus Kapabacteria bacterium]|nr:TolC family protein [Candidatus Kapabacteria bacterium]
MNLFQKVMKLTFYIGIVSIFYVGLAQNAQAQVRSLTLEEAVKIAVSDNAETIIARQEVTKAETAVKEAYGYALPSVDLTASFAHFIEKPKMPFPDFEAMLSGATYGVLEYEGLVPEGTYTPGPLETKLQSFALANNLEAKAQITQVLFNATVLEGIGATKIYEDLSKEQLNSKITEVIVNVKKAFYGVLLTKEMHTIMLTSLENAQQNLSNLQSMLKQGLVSEYDAMQAEVRVENIRPSVVQIENAHKSALDGLKMLLGIDPATELEVFGNLELDSYSIPNAKETINEAVVGNRGIRTLELKIQMDKAFIQVDKTEYYPSLAAFGNYTYAGQSDDFDMLTYSSAMVGVSLQMNLFNGMRTQRKVEQKTIVMNQTREQIIMAKNFVTIQVKSKIMDLERVIAQLEAQDRNVKMAERTYEIASIRFKEGTAIQLEIENAENALRQAKTNKMQSIFDYLTAQSELEHLIGTIDPKYL